MCLLDSALGIGYQDQERPGQYKVAAEVEVCLTICMRLYGMEPGHQWLVGPANRRSGVQDLDYKRHLSRFF